MLWLLPSWERRVTEKGLMGKGMPPVLAGMFQGAGRVAVGDGGTETYFSSDDVKTWPLPPPGGLKMGVAVSPADKRVLMPGCLSVELGWV